MKFKNKPVVIEAEQYLRHSDVLPFDTGFTCGPVEFEEDGDAGPYLVSSVGPIWVNNGDWIIKNVMGEFSRCAPEIFTATYEPSQE